MDTVTGSIEWRYLGETNTLGLETGDPEFSGIRLQRPTGPCADVSTCATWGEVGGSKLEAWGLGLGV